MTKHLFVPNPEVRIPYRGPGGIRVIVPPEGVVLQPEEPLGFWQRRVDDGDGELIPLDD